MSCKILRLLALILETVCVLQNRASNEFVVLTPLLQFLDFSVTSRRRES